jgi:Protein related to penicillin acylase
MVTVGFDGTALAFEDLFRSAPFDPASTVPNASESAVNSASIVSSSRSYDKAGWAASIQTTELHQATLALGRQYLSKIRDLPIFQRILDRQKRSGSNEWAVSGVLDDLSVVPPDGAIPAFTLIVPRRNNGPILELDLTKGIALSVQYTGFSATCELDTFRIWNKARGLNDFRRGLRFFDFGSVNWAYSDVHGNIAYFTSGEMPVREDLQAGTVNGLPPFFIRNGTGGNKWLPVQNPQPNQAVPFEILPSAEMPHIINPPAGFFVNANNDPLGITLDNDPLNQCRSGSIKVKECQPGDAIYYLNPGYVSFRAGRITQLIRQKLSTGSGKISFQDMQEIQADTGLRDAQFFVPFIRQAFANAQLSTEPTLAALGTDPRVASAVNRLANWDFTAPTGIPQGYDASDGEGKLSLPSDAEIASSIAATLYNVWRGQFIRNTIDAPLVPLGLPKPDHELALSALRNLLDNFATNQGVGASGVNFFNVPGISSADEGRGHPDPEEPL